MLPKYDTTANTANSNNAKATPPNRTTPPNSNNAALPKKKSMASSENTNSVESGGKRNGAGAIQSRQSSVEQDGRSNASRKHKLHPAERKAVLLAASNSQPDGFKKGPHAMNAFRRLSRAEFPFKKAGDKMQMTSLRKIMEKFERHSTIHGICHAALAPNKRWRRFWLGVFAICFVILVIQVIYLIIKYFGYPKTVDLDLKFENAPFPSVTFCNLNPYKASALGDDANIRATLDVFKNKEQETGNTGGLAASLKLEKSVVVRRAVGRRRRELIKRAKNEGFERRYLQVYAQCYCEINRLSAERKRGSCFAAYKGKVSFSFVEGTQLHNFHPTKCLCQLDWITKTLWPCFPYNTWKEHVCTECVDQLGHCPMRFYSYQTVGGGGVPPNGNGNNTGNGKSKKGQKNSRKDNNNRNNKSNKNMSNTSSLAKQPSGNNSKSQLGQIKRVETLDSADDLDVCVCHREYNHCVQNNINGEVPEILPAADLDKLNFTQSFVDSSDFVGLAAEGRRQSTTTTTTTQAPEIVEAMGYEELEDEIAIKSKAQENLRFAMGEKPIEERMKMSQTKDELILKCSFNQRDCDIEKDFNQYFDPTYGNCYTFNWDRNANVTAHRAGANYGLKVMLYANVTEYLPISEAVGFRITVHDKRIVPFADAFGYNAPTGFMSSFGVRMKKFFRLESPYGHCSEGGEESKYYIYKGYSYSIEGCHRSCTQHEIINICGCADPLYPVPKPAHACPVTDPFARNCIENSTKKLSDLIAQGKLENCKCPQPCRETAYEVTYSAARWPSGTTNIMECKSTDDLCMEKYRTNAAMVQVFYEELNYETLSESPAYGLTSLVADLGGLTGLWIGISIVSILEVVQLIWFCLDYYRAKKMQQLSIRRRSITSSGASSVKMGSKAPSNPSLGGRSAKSLKGSVKGSAPGNGPPVALIIQEEDEVHSSSESSSAHTTKRSLPSTGRYLAPGEELPCTCLYGSRGQIVFMKPLCPFHGCMVRRCSEMYSSDDAEGYNEEEDDEDGDKEEEGAGTGGAVANGAPPTISDEERRVLQREANKEERNARKREKRNNGEGEENEEEEEMIGTERDGDGT